MNKKGFTLVELLAVIVILAVVMLIAVTAVGPLMSKSRKSALATEGIGMIDAAKTAFQAEQLNGASLIKATTSVCFDLKWLYNKNYFEKGNGSDGYTGSVLVSYSGGKYTYRFWISNGTYRFGGNNLTNSTGVDPNAYDVENTAIVADAATASSTCGKAVQSNKLQGVVYCTGTTCNPAR